MKALLYLLLIFICLGTKPQQTYSISGTVNDEKGHPIPGAIVFLTNTKNATATDASGKFELPGLAAGPYEVVVKMLGFNPDIRTVRIENKAIALDVKLKEANTTLNTVTIKDKPDINRQAFLQRFIENLIGKSTNADQCKLLNPEALNFYYNKKSEILNAYADDFLIIENKALGYEIKYLLKEFQFYEHEDGCHYVGYPYFEELKGNDEQQRQWEINRKIAYLGSSRHFFRSVMNNTVKANGFAISESLYYPASNAKRYYIPWNPDSLFTTINGAKTLITRTSSKRVIKEFYITYKNAKQPGLFYKTGYRQVFDIPNPSLYQISMIRPVTDSIKIDKEMLLNPVIAFSFSGYWAWERIADDLPLDYVPDRVIEKIEIINGLK